jgi:carbon monoxide dehydrogenase subunit G
MKSKVRIEYTKGGPREGLWYDGAIEQDEVNSHGSVLFEIVDGGTRVTWTDTGTIARTMGGGLAAPVLGKMLTPFFQGILAELKTVVEEDIELVDAE